MIAAFPEVEVEGARERTAFVFFNAITLKSYVTIKVCYL
jgi:hypothetical protein